MTLSATCHCGAVRIHIPRPPDKLTNCNCSLCRRTGALWAYFTPAEVRIDGHPEHTEGYVQGDKTLSTVRCRHCGIVTHWEPIGEQPVDRMAVNARNFDPLMLGSSVRIRFFDGADSWTYVGEWSPADSA